MSETDRRPSAADAVPAADAGAGAATGTHGLILQTAREMFSRHGYRGTSVRRLTSRLGLTPAALYYHFDSKESVLDGVIAGMERGGATLLAHIAELERSPAALREVFNRYFDLLAADIDVFRFVANDFAVQQSAAGRRLRAQARDLFAWLTGSSSKVEDRIRAAAAVGTIRLSLEQSGVEPDAHRDAIIGRALQIMTD